MMTKQFRIFGMIVFALLVLGGLLFLDLRAHGLFWQFFWSQTGEEEPIGQIRGMLELGGNLIRQPLDTQPNVPIAHTDVKPFGINVFLQKEVEEPKLRAMLDMIQAAGFTWLRQEFPWEDLEIDGRGQFTDSRVDRDGDGVKDTVDAWAKYDRIVDLSEEYGFQLWVRLSNPPYWAQTNQSDSLADNLAPPADLQDFVNFAAAVAERYKGRIQYYQIWNEPNIYPEWGEQFANPAAYTEMLCRTYAALKAIDPHIVVISAAIAPTISLDGYMGYQDVAYLQAMYDHGAGACFDILAAQGYGLFSGPTDRRQRLTTVNYARHEFYRDVMVANGDAAKPIWLSEAAWNANLDAQLPRDQIADFERFGMTTQAQAARFMPLAYQRATEEWSWIGVVSYWFFTRPDPFEAGQSFYYFRMVEPDYQPDKPTFTPLPVYTAMQDYIAQAQQTPILYRGVHQAESWEVQANNLAGENELQPDDQAEFGQARPAHFITFRAHGTQVQIRLKMTEAMNLAVDGEQVRELPNTTDQWQTITLHESFTPETHEFTLRHVNGDPTAGISAPFLVDSISIYDTTLRNFTPIFAAGLGIMIFGVGVLLLAIRRRIFA